MTLPYCSLRDNSQPKHPMYWSTSAMKNLSPSKYSSGSLKRVNVLKTCELWYHLIIDTRLEVLNESWGDPSAE